MAGGNSASEKSTPTYIHTHTVIDWSQLEWYGHLVHCITTRRSAVYFTTLHGAILHLITLLCALLCYATLHLITIHHTTLNRTPIHKCPSLSYIHSDMTHNTYAHTQAHTQVRTLMSLVSVFLIKLKTFNIFSNSPAATAAVAFTAAGLAFHIL
jgi:hypothetical protein